MSKNSGKFIPPVVGGSSSKLWSNKGSDPMLDLEAFIQQIRQDQGQPPLSLQEKVIISQVERDMRENPQAWRAYMQKLIREAEHEQAAEDHQASGGSEQEEGSNAG